MRLMLQSHASNQHKEETKFFVLYNPVHIVAEPLYNKAQYITILI